jgi:gas vesicle protein
MNQSGKTSIAILAVVAIVGFTLLLTTDKGEKARKKMSKKGKKLWKKAKETASDFAHEASDLTNKIVSEGKDLL